MYGRRQAHSARPNGKSYCVSLGSTTKPANSTFHFFLLCMQTRLLRSGVHRNESETVPLQILAERELHLLLHSSQTNIKTTSSTIKTSCSQIERPSCSRGFNATPPRPARAGSEDCDTTSQVWSKLATF